MRHPYIQAWLTAFSIIAAYIFLPAVAAVAAPGTISTYAGGNTAPAGSALRAVLMSPRAVAVDPAGSLYIPDRDLNQVLKITVKGYISIVAGNGMPDYCGDGGPAVDACLNSPRGVAVDAAGNVYISDTDNLRVRRVDADGRISTVAGNGTADFSGDGGPAEKASINYANGLAVDEKGNLYIADTSNCRIRRVDVDGTITTIAGDGTPGFGGDAGPAHAAFLSYPYGVAAGPGGVVYIADSGNNRIRMVDGGGVITTLAGNGSYEFSGDGGQAAEAGLDYPYAIAPDDSGNLYISDTFHYRVRKVSKEGVISTVAGTGISGFNGDIRPALTAHLDAPRGLAVDAGGTVYFADNYNHRVRALSADGLLRTIAGSGIAGFGGDGAAAVEANLDTPSGVAVDAGGTLYLADTLNHRIRRIDADGTVSTIAGTGIGGYAGDGGGAAEAQLDSPRGIARDILGNVYFSDSANHRVRKITAATGIISTVAGTGIAGCAGDGDAAHLAVLNEPRGLAVDASGALYIADSGNHRVRKVSPAGIISTAAGSGAAGYSGDGGPAVAAQLWSPRGVVVDNGGSLYIADTENQRIRKVLPDGTITTAAGSGIFGSAVNGSLAGDVSLAYPYGIALKGNGNILIADTYDNRVLEVSSTGRIVVLAGNGLQEFSGDGSAAIAAGLNMPEALAVDTAGMLYLADTGNHRIRKITPVSGPAGTVVINSGADQTTSRRVYLALSCLDMTGTDCVSMRLSVDGQLDTEPWQPFTKLGMVVLPGTGTQTVQVEFRDVYDQTVVSSDSINVIPPPPTGSIAINNGASLTFSPEVTLSLSCSAVTAGATCQDMRFSTDGVMDSETWLPYAAAYPLSLPGSDGSKTVSVQFRDSNGTLSTVYSAGITLFQQQVTLTATPPAVSSATVTFTFSAPVVTAFECRFDREEGTFFLCSSPLTKTLSGGTHFFEVRLVDSNSGVHSVPVSYEWTVIDSLAGAAYTWGRNNYGQLGIGSYDTRPHPVMDSMPAPVGLVQVSVYGGHAVGLRNDGTVWEWGSNLLSYSLSVGNTNPAQIPAVPGGFENIREVAAGAGFNLALKTDGTVWGWGYNYYGELGTAAAASQPVPVQIPGLTGIVHISAGQYSALALKGDGSVVAWGSNSSNQLGIGVSDLAHHDPTPVPGISGIIRIAACSSGTQMALDSSGRIWSWGSGTYATPGRTGSSASPAMVSTVNGMGPVSAIACGAELAMAVANGVVWTWGYNWYGQLGIGSIPDANGSVYPVSTGIQTNGIIAAGSHHALAVSRSNTLYSWGANNYGELGIGLYDSSPHPAPREVGYLSGVTSVAAGNGFSVALTENWVRDPVYLSTSLSTVRSVVDGAGKLHVVFNSNSGMKYTTNVSGSWVTETLPVSYGVNVAMDISGTGADELLHLTYSAGYNVYHAFRLTAAGGSWTVETAVAGATGSTTAGGTLSADADGTLHLSYSLNYGLYYLKKPAGGSWSVPVQLDTSSLSPALAVGSDGTIHLAYQKSSSLYYRTNSAGIWGGATQLVAKGGTLETGAGPSIRLSGTSDAVVYIAYSESPDFGDHLEHRRLKFITNRSQAVGGPETGPWVDAVIDDFEVKTGVSPSLDVRGGKIGIAYNDYSNRDLKYALAADQNGPLMFRITTVDFEEDVGDEPSFAFDALGIAHIAYLDVTYGALKYASNADIRRPAGTIAITGPGLPGYTTAPDVTLSLSCNDGSGSGCWQMKFSSDNVTWSQFESFAASRPWTLSADNGWKRVYTKYRDAANNWSEVSYTDLFLDTVQPTGTLGVTSSGGFTSSRLVLLNTSCSDAGGAAASGCGTMRFSTDGISYASTLPYGPESSVFLSAGDGPKDISVIYRDKAGNDSAVYHSSVVVDSTPPTTTATPSGGDKSRALTVELSCSDGSGSGCASTWYSLDGSPERQYVPGSTIALSGMTHQAVLTCYSVDKLGNREPLQTQTYTFLPGQTALTLDVPPTLLQSGALEVSGKLTRYPDSVEHPDNDMDLSGLPVSLTIAGPAGSQCETPCSIPSTLTYSTLGHYRFSGIERFNLPGVYSITAHFSGTGLHQASQSATETILVGASAGYAIIVEGKINNGEGLDSHNKTVNRVYATLRERGFEDDNIMYFNYAGTQIPGVDAVPLKWSSNAAVPSIRRSVETWARDRMNGAPAPLYLIFVDHGNSNTFYIDPDTITPAELNSWLTVMEAELTPAARLQKRIVILGSCYSGSFITALKRSPDPGAPGPDPPFRLPDAGRIIITSSAADEQSYKGPNEPDGIRSGEFFIEELFKQLSKGSSLKTAFSAAAGQTRAFTSQGSGSPNSITVYHDTAVQHPLLEDDGLGSGSNTLVDGTGDGMEAAAIHLGVGATNASLGPADIKTVTPTRYLTSSATRTSLTLEAFSNAAVSSAWIEIKSPATTLTGNGQSGQLDLDLPRRGLTLTGGLWQALDDAVPPQQLDLFAGSGKYEIYYFTKSTNARISEMKRSVVYKDRNGNTPPADFGLVAPPQSDDPLVPTKVGTAFNMVWEPSSDSDGVTYTIQIATDGSFSDSSTVFLKEELETTWYYLDSTAGLHDLTDYHWRVIAVDRFGRQTVSSRQWSFRTDNTNFPAVCLVTGSVTSQPPAPGVEFAVTVLKNAAVHAQGSTFSGGSYLFNLVPGSYVFRAGRDGYTSGPDVPVTIVSCPPSPYVPPLTVTALSRTLQVSVTGGGRVYESPAVPDGIDCSSSDPLSAGCNVSSPAGESFSLIAAAGSWQQRFGSWSGPYCSGSSNPLCSFTLTGDTAVTAGFLPNLTVRVNSTDYASLQQACSDIATVSGSLVKAVSGYTFQENLLLDQEKTLTIDGGFSSLELATRDGGSTLLHTSGERRLVIRKGRLNVRGIAIR